MSIAARDGDGRRFGEIASSTIKQLENRSLVVAARQR
jgi:hypothetical protein